MAARWTMHSYWRTIHAMNKKLGITVPLARSLYRALRDREGTKVYASYLDKHPRIVQRSLSKILAEKQKRILQELEAEIEQAEETEVQEFSGAFDSP